MEEIKKLITLGLRFSPIEQAYNRFCLELETAISMTFNNESYIKDDKITKVQYILRNVVQSLANKLYVQKTFLKR